MYTVSYVPFPQNWADGPPAQSTQEEKPEDRPEISLPVVHAKSGLVAICCDGMVGHTKTHMMTSFASSSFLLI